MGRRGMAVYLAARYGRRKEMLALSQLLEAAGHRVTARWVHGLHDTAGGMSDQDAALEDLVDVELADAIIAFTETPGVEGRARGGRHVEFGWALARGKRLIVFGPRENVFHHHPRVEVVENVLQLLSLLSRARRWDPALKMNAGTHLAVVVDETAEQCLECGHPREKCGGQHQERTEVLS